MRISLCGKYRQSGVEIYFLFGHFPIISPSSKCLLFFLILIFWLRFYALQPSLLTGELGLCESSHWEQQEGRKTRGTNQRNQTAQMNLVSKAKIS